MRWGSVRVARSPSAPAAKSRGRAPFRSARATRRSHRHHQSLARIGPACAVGTPLFMARFRRKHVSHPMFEELEQSQSIHASALGKHQPCLREPSNCTEGLAYADSELFGELFKLCPWMLGEDNCNCYVDGRQHVSSLYSHFSNRENLPADQPKLKRQSPAGHPSGIGRVPARSNTGNSLQLIANKRVRFDRPSFFLTRGPGLLPQIVTVPACRVFHNVSLGLSLGSSAPRRDRSLQYPRSPMRHAALLIATLATLNTNLVAQTRPPAPADSIASEVRTIVLRMQAAVRENDRRALATLIGVPPRFGQRQVGRGARSVGRRGKRSVGRGVHEDLSSGHDYDAARRNPQAKPGLDPNRRRRRHRRSRARGGRSAMRVRESHVVPPQDPRSFDSTRTDACSFVWAFSF